MRYTALSFLVGSLSVSLVKPLSSGPFDEVGPFDLNSYSDAPPIGLGESTTLAEADLNSQPVGEPIFLDSAGSSAESDDLFGTQDYSSFSNVPDAAPTNSDALLVALSPSPGSSDQIQANPTPSPEDSGKDETPPPDLGETLDNYINEGLNLLLQNVDPFDKECDMKTAGRIPLCCNSWRKMLPYAYGCKRYDSTELNCHYYNFQFCCSGFNPIDQEGIGCTKGFYSAGAKGETDDVSGVDT